MKWLLALFAVGFVIGVTGCGTDHHKVEEISPGVFSICNSHTSWASEGHCDGSIDPGLSETCASIDRSIKKITTPNDDADGVVLIVCGPKLRGSR